mmetsp:Transcript_20632/g.51991  ORF Transcript_20632/g.51991 Transcript_20632/m.51991 type:complete len:113 (+) Transcript_20632:201-539(+)
MADAPPPSGERGERGRGGFGRGFGGRGRGDRGRGRGRGRGQKEEEKWVPCTKLGRLVQQVRGGAVPALPHSPSHRKQPCLRIARHGRAQAAAEACLLQRRGCVLWGRVLEKS